MSARDPASARQLAAARPEISTWLSANAGSGKTKVLTDRVARLLLNGVLPEHILCLTYTKAAASEMQNRLFERLGAWSMRADTILSSPSFSSVSASFATYASLASCSLLTSCSAPLISNRHSLFLCIVIKK